MHAQTDLRIHKLVVAQSNELDKALMVSPQNCVLCVCHLHAAAVTNQERIGFFPRFLGILVVLETRILVPSEGVQRLLTGQSNNAFNFGLKLFKLTCQALSLRVLVAVELFNSADRVKLHVDKLPASDDVALSADTQQTLPQLLVKDKQFLAEEVAAFLDHIVSAEFFPSSEVLPSLVLLEEADVLEFLIEVVLALPLCQGQENRFAFYYVRNPASTDS
mmetsp:Transcript_7627/g.14389  ORF Transcript_7627/g.14389 Transcript_7627/m.14389 type:complete len:219 (-) Transcript_7627:1120-1776(-)